MRYRLHKSGLCASSRFPVPFRGLCGIRMTFRGQPTLLLGGWIRRTTAILVALPHHKCRAADHPHSRLEILTAMQRAYGGPQYA